MAEDFRALRDIKGHFAGGTWNEDVDKWQGKKHRLMQELLSHLLQGSHSSEEVLALLGQPDRVWPASASEHTRLLQQTEWQGQPEGELWAYHWRGEHDQLIIALDRDKVTAGGWLFAWE